jgi:hypothetical protein
VAECVRRAERAGITWPLDLDDDALERRLFARKEVVVSAKAEPDFALVRDSLRHKEVTLQLLWELCRSRYLWCVIALGLTPKTDEG